MNKYMIEVKTEVDDIYYVFADSKEEALEKYTGGLIYESASIGSEIKDINVEEVR